MKTKPEKYRSLKLLSYLRMRDPSVSTVREDRGTTYYYFLHHNTPLIFFESYQKRLVNPVVITEVPHHLMTEVPLLPFFKEVRERYRKQKENLS